MTTEMLKAYDVEVKVRGQVQLDEVEATSVEGAKSTMLAKLKETYGDLPADDIQFLSVEETDVSEG